jgi:iron-sulfur cluster assembly protein
MITDFKVNITETAANLVKESIDGFEGSDCHLYFYVAGGGCSGLQYGLAVSEGDPEIDDYIVFDKDIKIVVDGNSAKYLNGTIIDYTENGMQKGFKVENPNAGKSCGCGSSFSVEGETHDTCGGCGHK